MEATKAHDLTTMAPSSVTSQSPWHSPVPYLFGGLAALLCLIAFALLILACSFWKLSGYLDGGSQEDGRSGEGDVEARAGDGGKPVFEEKILVIMAGEVTPTFLATPTVSSRSSSVGVGCNNCSCAAEKAERSEVALEDDAAKHEGSSRMQGL